MKRAMFHALLLLLLLAPGIFAADIPLVRFSEDPWPPYTYGDEGEAPTGGIAVRFVAEIFSRLGVETELRLYPWRRCLYQMQTGERDALMLLGYSEERSNYLDYTESLMEVRDLIYYNRNIDTLQWNEYRDLKPYVFARTADFQYGKGFEEAVREYSIAMEEAPSDLLSFKMLASGRVDAFISNEMAAREIFRQNPELKGAFKVAEKPLKSGSLFMAFSKKSTARKLLPEVNRVIRQLKKDGTLSRIVNEF